MGCKRFCTYCRRNLDPSSVALAPTKDHFVPKSHGGTKVFSCCFACNQMKGDMTVDQWRQFTKEVPEWWRYWRSVPCNGAALFYRRVMMFKI
jgi:5-methylcytosine-specific restriction endonuclease McrA